MDQWLVLPDKEKKDIALKLLKSLPRHELSDLHAGLTQYLRRDILAALPRELALGVFSRLDTESLLVCSAICKSWNSLATDQALWRKRCESRSIRPNERTTWRDVFQQRDRVLRQAQAELLVGPEGDEAWEEELEGDDDVVEQVIAGPTGTDPAGRDRPHGRAVSLSSTSHIAGTARTSSPTRMPWQAAGLPIFLLPPSTPQPRTPALSAPVNYLSPTSPERTKPISAFPIPSHAQDPRPRPKVNYKHLYLLHRILAKRWAAGVQKPYVMDSRRSIIAGGLEGHREGIYCLQILDHEMVLNNAPTLANSSKEASRRASFGATGPAPIAEGCRWLFSGSRDKSIRLWDLNTGKVVRVFSAEPPRTPGGQVHGHTGSVLAMCVATFGPDEKAVRMVSGGSDGRVIVWDVLTGKIVQEIQAHERTEAVLCVRFDGKRIVSCSKDHSIRTFDAITFEPLLVIGGNHPTVGHLADNHLLTADIPTEIEGHRAAVNAVALSGEYIISASGDKSIRVWDASTGENLLVIGPYERGIATLDMDLRKGTVVTGSSDNHARMYELLDWGVDISKPLEVEAVRRSVASANPTFAQGLETRAGRKCCAVSRSRYTDKPESSGLALGCLKCEDWGHSGLVRSVWLGETVIVTGSYDTTIKLWDRRTGLLICDMPDLHTNRIFSVVGDRSKLISTGIDQKIIVWDFAHGLDTSFLRESEPGWPVVDNRDDER